MNNLQLQMFAPAGQLSSALASGAMNSGDLHTDNYAQVQRMKIREAKQGGEMNSHGGTRGRGQTLADSMRDHGIRDSIEVFHAYGGAPILVNGHHRVFMAEHMDPSMEVPIDHTGGRVYARTQRRVDGGHV